MKYRYAGQMSWRLCSGEGVILSVSGSLIQFKPDNAAPFQVESSTTFLESCDMAEIIKVGDIVRYQDGRQDGQLPAGMTGEVRELQSTAQGTKRARVVIPTGGSALIEEFRLTKVNILFS